MKKTESILDLEAVLQKRGNLSKSQHYDDVSHGLWTRPVRVSGVRVGWPSDEADTLIAASIAGWTPERIKRLVEKLHARRQAKSATLAARYKEGQAQAEAA